MTPALFVIMMMLGAAIFVSIRAKQTKIWELVMLGTFGALLGQVTIGSAYLSGLSSVSTSLFAAIGLG
jgi:hypothetical protein